jgi:hypothetical protein
VGIDIAPLKKGGRKSNLNRPSCSLKLAGAILLAGIFTVVLCRLVRRQSKWDSNGYEKLEQTRNVTFHKTSTQRLQKVLTWPPSYFESIYDSIKLAV